MIEEIINRQNDNGGKFWSRADGNIHAPFGFSTIDNSNIADAIDFIFSYQTKDGCFKVLLNKLRNISL